MLASLRSLAGWRARTPDAPAVSDDMRALSYDELAARVAGFAESASQFPPVVGLLAENGVDWAIADLGLSAAGCALVPLPVGFTQAQWAHIVRDADIGLVLHDTNHADEVARLAVPSRPLEQFCQHDGLFPLATASTDHRTGPNRIIYTSGTTGAPKGVRIAPDQISFMTGALSEAIGATRADRYLSVMPLALLLEQLAAIHVSVHVGGETRFATSVASRAARGQPGNVAAAMEDAKPTVAVMVPAMLRLWLAGLSQHRPPASLRYVAVGGAHLAPALAEAAWATGIPVHEGYGLSECTSVVALNRPSARVSGTVGRPLVGLDVSISGDGEIVVAGPSVMDGYLHGEAVGGIWRTGDLGEFDPDGNLIVRGRKDSVLVTQFGRNVSPEWLESLLTADPRIAHAQVLLDADQDLTALLGLSEAGVRWIEETGRTGLNQLIEPACSGAPAYARPGNARAVPDLQLVKAGIIGADGRLDRTRGQSFLAAIPGGEPNPGAVCEGKTR